MCCADNVLLLSGFSACVAVLLVPVLLRQSTRWVTAECRERERERLRVSSSIHVVLFSFQH